jgi:hypothetical protein
MLFVTITHDGEELERFVLPVRTLPSDAVHVAPAIRELVETEFAGEPLDELSTTITGRTEHNHRGDGMKTFI